MMRKRRILVVTESLGIGGTETHLVRLLPQLCAIGWDVTVFCLTARGRRAEMVEAAGGKVYSPSPGSRSAASRNPLYFVRAAVLLFRLMRRLKPQIVHFYLPRPYLFGAPLAIAAGVPVKIMSRRSLAHYQQNWPMLSRLERVFHGHMNAVTGNAFAIIKELRQEGIPENKLRLIYNGVAQPSRVLDREAARQSLGIKSDVFLGVVLANLHPYKGHQDLIEGLSAVAKDLPPGWRVLCAGRDEGIRGKLEQLVDARRLGPNVEFIGERTDVPTLLAAADFSLITPTHNEGFSNAILESMAAGLPMIATDIGGNPEAVIDEVTGLIVPSNDPQAIGEAVRRLVRDSDLRNRLGIAGQSRVLKEFTGERCAAAHTALYDELLATRHLKAVRSLESTKTTRVLTLTRYSRKGPSSRVRFMQYCPQLTDHGVELDIAPLLPVTYLQRRYANQAQNLSSLISAYLRRIVKMLRASQYDVIWLEKEALPSIPAGCERMLYRKPVVLDVDDAWHLRYSSSSNPVLRFLLANKIETIARHAQAVTVSNRFLRGWAEHAGARSIQLIPTVVDMQRYPATPLPPANPFTVGWIGTPSTTVYLEEIRDALQRVLSQPNSRLVLVGAADFSLPGVEVELHPWSEEQEVFLLQQMHVGIMPLRDGPWEQAKSAYKAVQYMAAGRPVVASPVGACLQIVEEGISGLFATDPDSWATAIKRLRYDPSLASTMGQAGRRRVERFYSLEQHVSTLATILKSASLA